MLRKFPAVIAIVVAISGAVTQVSAAEAISRGGIRLTVAPPTSQGAHDAAAPVRSDLQTIYSTFGPDSPAWDAWIGWSLQTDSQTAAAMAFTPQADFNVHEIRLALTNIEGSEKSTVTLHADANGIPGQLLAKFKLMTMPEFGKCCATRAVSSEEGIPISAGQTYWVAAHVPRIWGMADSAWNWTTLEILEHPMAVRRDGAWHATNDWASAFAVYGKPAASR